MAVPAPGVYAVTASIEGSIYEGMGNIGNNPTFNDVEHARLEVNLFNCSGDLYGKTMSVQFRKYIRAEKKFSGVEELCRQIEEDKKVILNHCLEIRCSGGFYALAITEKWRNYNVNT